MIEQLTNILQMYKQQIDDDFRAEWSKQHFKWFFKKRRQKKLQSKIFHRYKAGMFGLVENYIEDAFPKVTEEFIDNLTNIKDIPFGDKADFTEEN